MIKILLVANTDWYLFRFRLSLAQQLRDQGYEVVFVSPAGIYTSLLEKDGFQWINWGVGRLDINPIKEVGAIISFLRIINHEKPNIIHLHTIKPVLYGSLCARFIRNTRVVRSITGRGYVFLGKDFRARIIKPIVKLFYRYALNDSRGIVIFENATDQEYFVHQKLVRSEHTKVIEGVGVDTDYYTSSPEPDGTPIVLLAGRMLWDKGVGTFVEAARILHTRIQVKFLLVGQPDAGNPASIPSEILDTWTKEGVVDWQGWASDMRTVFSACHIVSLPSMGEGLPTILIEAASSGRPIVATDVPGCRDVVRDGVNGLLVPPQDPVSLARAIEYLILNPGKRKAMGHSGRDLVLGRFSTPIVNAATLKVYDALLGIRR